MSADFTPSMETYKNPHYFRFWCQKVLPLVYDDSLSYYELLCKVVKYLNDVIEDSDAMKTNIGNLLTAYNELQDYVNHYFDNLDVQTEINNKLDNMVESGELSSLLSGVVADQVPKFVASTSSMTDHNAIYVLTTDSHIYTYNGSSFIDTGVVYGVAANAFTPSVILTETNYSGLGISTITDLEPNKSYGIGRTITADMISGLPYYGSPYTINTFKPPQAGTSGYTVYQAVYGNAELTRESIAFSYTNGAISPWMDRSTSEKYLKAGPLVSSTNYQQLGLSALTDFESGSVYGIGATITENMITGLPHYGIAGFLSVFKPDTGSTATGYTKYVYTYGNANGIFEYVAFSYSNGIVTKWFGNDKNFATVGTGGNFPTIAQAAAYINESGTVYVLPGTYEEQLSFMQKEIHLVGADKTTVILIDRSGNYTTPPIEIAKGSVSNMTIIETGEGEGDKTAYCVHSDFATSAGASVTLENLILINGCHACVGIGARNGFNFTMKNCELHQTAELSERSQRGTFYAHTRAETEGGQAEIKLINNVIISDANLALTLQRVSNQSVSMNCTLIGNSLKANDSVAATIFDNGGSAAGYFDSTWIKKDIISHGNNLQILNN